MGLWKRTREPKGEQPASLLIVHSEGPVGAIVTPEMSLGKHRPCCLHRHLECFFCSFQLDTLFIWVELMSVPKAEVEDGHGASC